MLLRGNWWLSFGDNAAGFRDTDFDTINTTTRDRSRASLEVRLNLSAHATRVSAAHPRAETRVRRVDDGSPQPV